MTRNHTRGILAIGIICLFIGVGIHPAQSGFSLKEETINISNNSLNTVYVDDDNTEGPWDGTLEYPFQYIQDGINNAKNGDTVIVFSGEYKENLIINKSIYLTGEGKENTIIKVSKELGIRIYVDDVIFEKFKIQTRIGHVHYAITVYNCRNVEIINNSIDYTVHVGIRLLNSNECMIKGNNISSHRSAGIYFEKSSSNIIRFNYFFDPHPNTGNGLGLRSSNNNIIEYNEFNSLFSGYWVSSSDNNWCKKNNFINVDGPVSVTYDSVDEYRNYENHWERNYFDKWIGLKHPLLRFFPYIFIGIVYIPWLDYKLPYWVLVSDRHPAQEPYDIENVKLLEEII